MAVKMTKKDAVEWVRAHSDDDEIDPDDLVAAFVAIYRRRPEGEEVRDMWSMICAGIRADV